MGKDLTFRLNDGESKTKNDDYEGLYRVTGRKKVRESGDRALTALIDAVAVNINAYMINRIFNNVHEE